MAPDVSSLLSVNDPSDRSNPVVLRESFIVNFFDVSIANDYDSGNIFVASCFSVVFFFYRLLSYEKFAFRLLVSKWTTLPESYLLGTRFK
jgi:hypothetical protein